MTYGDYPDWSGIKKILVIKLRHLGDVLLTGPVFTALKKKAPWASIDAYVYEETKPILEGHPAIAEIFGVSSRKTSFFKRLGKEVEPLSALRKKRYDCVLNLTEGDRGAIAAAVSGARFRVGFPPKGKWQKKLYTHLIKQCPNLRHSVERNLDGVRRMGVFPSWEDRELFFEIPPSARQIAEKIEKPFILVHPTSRWRFKCYPVAKMREIVSWLIRNGRQVVLTSGPDPVEIAMTEEVGRGLNAHLLAGKVSLKELGALIEAAELLLCVDSLPFHLGNALKKRVVALFGPTSDVTWGPWRNPHARVVAQPFSCRPCYQDGCGGSKQSDCLDTLPIAWVQEAIMACLKPSCHPFLPHSMGLEPKVLSEVGAARLGMREQFIHRSR